LKIDNKIKLITLDLETTELHIIRYCYILSWYIDKTLSSNVEHIGGVMVSMLTLSGVDCGLSPSLSDKRL